MKKKMKGNDLRFNWRIKDDEGHPYNVEEKDLTLVLRGPYGTVPVGDVNFEENVVSFTFFGKDQKAFGIYTATLIENAGRELMKTVDFVGAVELVPHTIQEGGASDSSQLSIETIDLESTIVVGIPGPRGLSMYQYAVKYMGFEGTEREFWEWYKEARDAAARAAENAADAQSSIEASEAEREREYTRLVNDTNALLTRLHTFETVFVDELPEASEATMFKYYLVPDPLVAGQRDLYLSYETNEGGYDWRKVGSTGITFGDYIRKDDVVILTEDEYEALRNPDPNKYYLTYEDSGEEEEEE